MFTYYPINSDLAHLFKDKDLDPDRPVQSASSWFASACREAQEAVIEADGHREGTTEPDAEAAKREEEGGEEAEEAEGDKEAASEEAQKASADASEPAGAGSEEAPGEADGGATTEDSGAEPQPGETEPRNDQTDHGQRQRTEDARACASTWGLVSPLHA